MAHSQLPPLGGEGPAEEPAHDAASQVPPAAFDGEAVAHAPAAEGAAAAAAQVPPPVAEAVVHFFACAECGKQFPTQRGLLCHGTHAHGRKRPSACFVVTSVCPGCGNDYRTRARAMEHVERGSHRCRVAVLESGLAPADPALVAAADEADRVHRRQARQAGVSELAGPPAILHRGV